MICHGPLRPHLDTQSTLWSEMEMRVKSVNCPRQYEVFLTETLHNITNGEKVPTVVEAE